MQRRYGKALGLLTLWMACGCSAAAQSPQYVTFSQAEPILKAYVNSLPAELKPGGQPTAAAWDAWVRRQDKEVRARLERGEEDTLTNLLRLGVTFTRQDRISYAELERFGHDKYVDRLADQRADDLIGALAAPNAGEGMRDLRSFLEKNGYNLHTSEGRKKLKAYLMSNLARMRDEVLRAEQELYTRKNADLSQQFKYRGISTDSNLYPDYSIELHQKHLMEQGLLKPGQIRRVAIVGPGLDFVNKNSGSDFYPPQSTQPFAVIDTLARLGLADPETVELTTFDISPRVNRHLNRARRDAAAGKWYTMQLLSDPSDQWNKDYASGFLRYWQHLGDEVGKPTQRISVPASAGNIWNRAVSVRPAVVQRVTPMDMNVVFQAVPLPADKRFDLVIGTNIFVYYNSFEQSLARANLATMIRPGGYLITNDALAGTVPTGLTDSLQTKIDVSKSDTEYMYTYARGR